MAAGTDIREDTRRTLGVKSQFQAFPYSHSVSRWQLFRLQRYGEAADTYAKIVKEVDTEVGIPICDSYFWIFDHSLYLSDCLCLCLGAICRLCMTRR